MVPGVTHTVASCRLCFFCSNRLPRPFSHYPGPTGVSHEIALIQTEDCIKSGNNEEERFDERKSQCRENTSERYEHSLLRICGQISTTFLLSSTETSNAFEAYIRLNELDRPVAM